MRIKPVEPGWYSLADAASYTGLSLKEITTAVSFGRLIAHKVKIASDRGGRRLIRRESLDAWIEGRSANEAVIDRPVADELKAIRSQIFLLRCSVEARPTVLPPRWMKLRVAAKYSGLSDTTLRKLIKSGAFRSALVGGSRLIDRVSLDEYIERWAAEI